MTCCLRNVFIVFHFLVRIYLCHPTSGASGHLAVGVLHGRHLAVVHRYRFHSYIHEFLRSRVTLLRLQKAKKIIVIQLHIQIDAIPTIQIDPVITTLRLCCQSSYVAHRHRRHTATCWHWNFHSVAAYPGCYNRVGLYACRCQR